MLRLINVSIVRGIKTLYSSVNLSDSPAERIGLVGPNGSGKSTLFSAILGEISTETGDIYSPDPLRIAHVAQRMTGTDKKALEWVLLGHEPLQLAKAKLLEAQNSSDDIAYAHALAELTDLNEGAIIAKAEAILHGLGFRPEDANKSVQDFSGGWRNRLALARALMRPADLLLLDEPTNHLDLDSVIWLENFLRQQECTIIVISHDRDFLDSICKTIWSIEDGTINKYTGNYTDFERMRAEKIRLQEAAYKAYERNSSHLKSFIERFRYKATKARQAQARIKMLERLETVEPVKAVSQWRFTFPEPEKIPQNLIMAEALDTGYGSLKILDSVKCEVRAGDRIGVLGVNGAGKSTLIKTLIGEIPPLAGTVRYGQNLNIGYFAQHQLDALRDDESPLQHLARIAEPDIREQELRNFLGTFKFTGNQSTEPVGPMSGGEKARLSLALIAWGKPNLLVLDEPTNHLDMPTREALAMALAEFKGALLLVSHDRHLLNLCTEQFWLVHDHKVSEFDGDLTEYAALVLADRKLKNREEKTSIAENYSTPNRKEQRKAQALERARIAAETKPLKTELKKVEQQLEELGKRKNELSAKLADSTFYQGNQDEVSEALREHGQLENQLQELENRWLELSEMIENIS